MLVCLKFFKPRDGCFDKGIIRNLLLLYDIHVIEML